MMLQSLALQSAFLATGDADVVGGGRDSNGDGTNGDGIVSGGGGAGGGGLSPEVGLIEDMRFSDTAPLFVGGAPATTTMTMTMTNGKKKKSEKKKTKKTANGGAVAVQAPMPASPLLCALLRRFYGRIGCKLCFCCDVFLCCFSVMRMAATDFVSCEVFCVFSACLCDEIGCD
jgi:hypothetical protein